MQRRALLIAFHFPPFGSSSGVHRTLKNVQYLPEFGWTPIVLTASPRAYETVAHDRLAEIPPETVVARAFCLDAARHLAVRGRYLRALAVPDRWVSWWLAGVYHGLRLIRRHRPSVIWSTFPIASAHLIGLSLHRLTGLPWVADIRDSMVEDDYPKDPFQRRVVGWVERRCVARARASVFTTPGAAELAARRHADVPAERLRVIGNGYDEEAFQGALSDAAEARPANRPLTLLHSGILYPEERDPGEFFAALRDLKAANAIGADRVRVVLRATGHDAHHSRAISDFGIEDIVELRPPLPYRAALREMLDADALLIFQAANCNQQIPAKIYEYFRAGRPIFALTDSAGDTAALLRDVGIETITPLDDRNAIANDLGRFLELLAAGRAPAVPGDVAARYSRRARARELAQLFDEVAA